MLLTCPSCKARYLVADTVIGPSGRRVRCAACKEVWQQSPPVEEAHRDIIGRDVSGTRSASTAAVAREPQFSMTGFQPMAMPQSALDFKSQSDANMTGTPAFQGFNMKMSQPDPSNEETPVFQRRPAGMNPFEEERPRSQAAVMAQEISRVSSRKRRSKQTGTYWLAGGFGLLLIGNIYFWSDSVGRFVKSLVPGVARFHINGLKKPASADAVSALKIAYTKPSPVMRGGHKVLPISGTISNPTPNTLSVPRLHGVLLDGNGKEIFSWSFPAPTVELATGQTTTFDTEANDIPEKAKSLRIGFENSGSSN